VDNNYLLLLLQRHGSSGPTLPEGSRRRWDVIAQQAELLARHPLQINQGLLLLWLRLAIRRLGWHPCREWDKIGARREGRRSKQSGRGALSRQY